MGATRGPLPPQLRDVGQADGDAHDLFAEAFADLRREGQELLCGQLLVRQPHDLVQDGRDRRVASQPHLLHDDAGHGRGVVQQRPAVVALQSGELFVRIGQRFVHEPLRLGRKVASHVRAKFLVA